MSKVIDLPAGRLAGELRGLAKMLSDIGENNLALICNLSAAYLTKMSKDVAMTEDLLDRLRRRANVADDDCRTDDADLFREALCALEEKIEV